MDILITGGLGFIGSHLADFYRKDNNVWIVDIAPYENWQKELSFTTKIEPYSVQDYAFRKHPKFDLVVHCASPVGILGILKKKGKIVEEIVSSTVSAIEIAQESAAKLIHVSTSEVYGRGGWLKETDTCFVDSLPSSPRKEYQIGKLAAEQIVLSSGIDSLIIRPFNIVGTRQSAEKGFVLMRFLEAVRDKMPLEVFYDGRQKRSFCHVKDFVEGVNFLLERRLGGVFNIGNPVNTMSINELANLVIGICEADLPIKHIEPDFPHFVEGPEKLPCIDKIMEYNWWPRITLEQTVQELKEFLDIGQK